MRPARQLAPEGSPREILEYFRTNPGRTIRHVIGALKLDLSTAYYGLTRLHDLGLVKRVGDKRPARWEVVADAPEPPAPVPLVPAVASDGPIKLFSSQPVYAPTGMPYEIVDGAIRPLDRRCAVQVLAIDIAQPREREPSREGRKNVPQSEHPWSYTNRNRRAA